MAHQTLAAHTVGVSHRNGAAIHVQTVIRNAKAVAAVQHLHGKGLVQLPQVDVAHSQAQAVEHLGHCKHRADAHFVRRTAGHGKAEEAAQRLQVPLLGEILVHHHAGAGAIGKLAGVAGGHGAARQAGAQAGHGFQRRAFTQAFVLADGDLLRDEAQCLVGNAGGDGDGRNLGIEQAGSLGRAGLLLAGGAVGVHGVAADAVALGHDLGRLQHVEVNVGAVLIQPAVLEHVLVHFLLHAGDAFQAASHIDTALTCNDALRGQRNALQAGGTVTVHGHAGHVVRQAGADHDLACDVGAGGALGQGAAHDHVFHLGRVNARALDGVLHHMAAERGAVGQVEGAPPALGQRGACGGYDDGGCHGGVLLVVLLVGCQANCRPSSARRCSKGAGCQNSASSSGLAAKPRMAVSTWFRPSSLA